MGRNGRGSRGLISAVLVLVGSAIPGVAAAGNFDWDPTAGSCRFLTLQDAMTDAENNGVYGSTILGKPNSYTLPAEVVFNYNYVVEAGNSFCTAPVLGQLVSFAAAPGERAFRVNNFDSLTLRNVHIMSGDPGYAEQGGNILVESFGTLIAEDSYIAAGTTTSTHGGCIAAEPNAEVTLTRVEIYDCYSDLDGGGIFLDADTLSTFTDVDIYNNEANAWGGGVGMHGGELTITGDSFIRINTGGGIQAWATNGDTKLILSGNTAVTGNDTFGGVAAGAQWTGLYVEVQVEDNVSIVDNEAVFYGGGISFASVGDASGDLYVSDEVTIESNEAGVSGGGIQVIGPVSVSISDDVRVMDNTAPTGGGLDVMRLWDDYGSPDVSIVGSEITALGASDPDTVGGVRFENNNGTDGSAIHAASGNIYANSVVVQGHENTAVFLEDDSDDPAAFTGELMHLNENDAVFYVERSILEVDAGYAEASCDNLDPLKFGFNRYCSEINHNTGMLLAADGGADVLIRTTSMLFNNLTSTDVAVDIANNADVTFMSNLVGNNSDPDGVSPVFVAVQAGGVLDAKQNTFADVGLPVTYKSGSSGLFGGNAAFDSGAGVAVKIHPLAVISGIENIGDWNGAVSSGFPNGTAPGFVTDLVRGDFHLSLASPAVDSVALDGGFDVEGRVRPQPFPAGPWDAGAIEVDQP